MAGPTRKFAAALIVASLLLTLFFVFTSEQQPRTNVVPGRKPLEQDTVQDLGVNDAMLKGQAIMPKLGNETAK